MKITSKLVFVSCATLLCTNSPMHITAAPTLSTDDVIVQTTIKSVNAMTEKIDGHVDRLSCTIRMDSDGNPVSSKTTVGFVEYHKKPEKQVDQYSEKPHTQTAEVFYKKGNSSLLLKDNKGKREVPVPSDLNI